MRRNDTKCKYMFMLPLKILHEKGWYIESCLINYISCPYVRPSRRGCNSGNPWFVSCYSVRGTTRDSACSQPFVICTQKATYLVWTSHFHRNYFVAQERPILVFYQKWSAIVTVAFGTARRTTEILRRIPYCSWPNRPQQFRLLVANPIIRHTMLHPVIEFCKLNSIM